MSEIVWVNCVGFPGYQVSNTGQVRRSAPGRKTFVGKILKYQKHEFGYPTVALTKDGRGIRREVHRLVCEAFHGHRPSPKHQVAHWDRNPQNVVASNLRWATKLENEADKFRHGTTPKGEKNPAAKLTVEDVAAIRARRDAGEELLQIADDFGIAFQTVSKVTTRNSWKHVP